MGLMKSLTKIRVRASTELIRRFYAPDPKCYAPVIRIPRLDEEFPREKSRTKQVYQQHWVECPEPVIIKRKVELQPMPVYKRKTKPKTAVHCMKLRDCDFSRSSPKICKFISRIKCDRKRPPFLAFSELMCFKPEPERTECMYSIIKSRKFSIV